MEGKSGKIYVESAAQARRNDLLEEFWDTYFEQGPDDALSQELERILEPEDFAAAHEIFEEKGVEEARAYFDTWPRKQSEEYYPGVFDAELSEPPDPKRIKAHGGRVKYAGGGRIRRAVKKLTEARYELEENPDPDIAAIARQMIRDPDTATVGKRILATEKRVLEGGIDNEKASDLYDRISRLFDEEIEKAKTKD